MKSQFVQTGTMTPGYRYAIAALLVFLLLPVTLGPAIDGWITAFSREQFEQYDPFIPPDWTMPETNDWVQSDLYDEPQIVIPPVVKSSSTHFGSPADAGPQPVSTPDQFLVNSQFYVSSL